jgi:hypothetical protein
MLVLAWTSSIGTTVEHIYEALNMRNPTLSKRIPVRDKRMIACDRNHQIITPALPPPWNLLAQHQTLQFLHSISRIEATRNDLEGETVSERCHMRWEVMLWLVSMANDYGSKVDPWSDVGVLSSKSSHFLGWQEVPNVDPYSRCTDDMKPHCLEFIAPSSLEFYK